MYRHPLRRGKKSAGGWRGELQTSEAVVRHRNAKEKQQRLLGKQEADRKVQQVMVRDRGI